VIDLVEGGDIGGLLGEEGGQGVVHTACIGSVSDVDHAHADTLHGGLIFHILHHLWLMIHMIQLPSCQLHDNLEPRATPQRT